MAAKTKARSRNTSPKSRDSGKDSIGVNSLTIENNRLKAELALANDNASFWRARIEESQNITGVSQQFVHTIFSKIETIKVEDIESVSEKVAKAALAIAKSLLSAPTSNLPAKEDSGIANEITETATAEDRTEAQ
jgi:hypothetical protein